MATSRTARDGLATFSDQESWLHPAFDLRVSHGEDGLLLRYESSDDADR